MLEQNKTLVHQFVEEFMNGHDDDAARRYVASDVQWHIGAHMLDSVEMLIGANGSYLNSFPDWQGTIDDQIAEGNKVVTRITFSGTHQGEFQGIPATGKRVTVTAIFIVRIEDGQIVEAWRNGDDMGMMMQLNAMPG